MRPFALAAALLLCASPAAAQEGEWEHWPDAWAPPPSSTPPPPPPLVTGPAPEAAPRPPEPPAAPAAPEPPPEPNRVSVSDGRALGPWGRGQLLTVGFPLVGLRVCIGLAQWLDVGVGFDSLYGLLNEPRLVFRFSLVRGAHWALALGLEGGVAFFTVRAPSDVWGPRWMTGRRNVNVQPSATVSYQGAHPRAARVFLTGGYLLALDTEPYQRTPLGGVSPGVVPGHNAFVKVGTELPLSARTSFLLQLGLDAHFRAGDSVLMPAAQVGLATSI